MEAFHPRSFLKSLICGAILFSVGGTALGRGSAIIGTQGDDGWRRTNAGWVHNSQWTASASQYRVASQLVKLGPTDNRFDQLRLHPAGMGLLQLIAVAVGF